MKRDQLVFSFAYTSQLLLDTMISALVIEEFDPDAVDEYQYFWQLGSLGMPGWSHLTTHIDNRPSGAYAVLCPGSMTSGIGRRNNEV